MLEGSLYHSFSKTTQPGPYGRALVHKVIFVFSRCAGPLAAASRPLRGRKTGAKRARVSERVASYPERARRALKALIARRAQKPFASGSGAQKF